MKATTNLQSTNTPLWQLTERGVVIEKRLIEYAEITSVTGWTFDFSINLASAIKHATLDIVVASGESFSLAEIGLDRKSVAKQKAITELRNTIKQATFGLRYQRFWQHLTTQKKIEIGTEHIDEPFTILGMLWRFFFPKKPSTIFLTDTGLLMRADPSLILDIRQRRESGRLECGVQRGNGNWPEQVCLSNSKPWFAEPRRAKCIRFSVASPFGTDVAMAAIDTISRKALDKA
jgi:hypothetical protein